MNNKQSGSIIKALMFWLLSFSLFMLAAITTLNMVLLNKNAVSETLVKAQTYQNIVTATIGLMSQQNDSSQDEGIKRLEPIIKSVITPNYLKSVVEPILGGLFGWLNGDSPSIQFEINTKQASIQLQSGIAQYLHNKVSSLPECNEQPINVIDPINATCKPRMVEVPSFEIEAQSLVGSIPIFQQESLSAADLGFAKITEQKTMSYVRGLYYSLKIAPYILITLALTSSALLIASSREKLKTVMRLGNNFLWIGFILTFVGLLTFVLTKQFGIMTIGNATEEQLRFIDLVFTPLMTTISLKIAVFTAYFGVAYIAIGGSIILTTRLITIKNS